ncbi:MAG TPA: CBS domain-containing protein [Deltaproteobacteria bacterium]|nr:CBS domain-containing protein [Deltaproteobacteria bacterium]OQC27802.1 MAG: Inosine-5'-monophosphate dehydrogenase [Deltaproteobacteria bacterium ADurb.Bin072]HRW79230.1 CBS domain-containing protein [Desulfomonilia bacterium]NMD41079.1 CBS domain-containing protein [Deltaproteobacteria bacterium]HNQ85110.1 CBS domain-containing protein [Deltaproteobacteria bacterium]
MDQVKDLMTTNVVTIRTVDTLREAIRMMSAGRFRRIPVVREGTLVGIVTDRDIRQALNSPVVIRERSADEYLLDSVTVGSSMTNNPLTTSPEDDILKAAEIMERNKIGGLPVVDGGRLVGIITISDLMNYLIRHLRGERSG